MGTDYIDAQDGIAYWAVEAADYSRVLRRVPLGTVANGMVSIYEGLGGGNIRLSALESKIGWRSDDPDIGNHYGDLDKSTIIKSSDPNVYLGGIKDQLYLLGGITHRALRLSALAAAVSVQADQTLLENSPFLGNIKDTDKWYNQYGVGSLRLYGYSLANTITGGFLLAQDKNTAAYDLGWTSIDDYVSGTRRNALGAAAMTTATLAPIGKLAAAEEMVSLYHGTSRAGAASIRESGIDLSIGRSELDFGRGFYTTTDKSQAVAWAAKRFGNEAAVLEFEVSKSGLDALRQQSFGGATAEWANFVRLYRTTGTPMHSLDVVSGPMLKNPGSFLRGAAPKALGQQTSFHTQLSIDFLQEGLVP